MAPFTLKYAKLSQKCKDKRHKDEKGKWKGAQD